MKGKITRIWKRVWDDIRDFKWAIFLFLSYYSIARIVFNAFCPMVIVSGLPCPACGMTRSIQFMLTGQFSRSYRANPMGLPWILFGIYFVCMRYILGKQVKYFNEILCVLLVVMIVVYIIRMRTLFPYRPPMSYTRGNMIERILPFYKEMLRKVFDVW